MASKTKDGAPTVKADVMKDPVTRSNADPQDAVAYIDISFNTTFGIDSAISLLNARNTSLDTPTAELKLIDYELGDQVAKKARVFAQMNAFMANQRAMRPPTEEMVASAKKLLAVLDSMIAADVTAQ